MQFPKSSRQVGRASITLVLLLALAFAATAAPTPAPKPAPPLALGWSIRQGACIMALCADPYGRLWIGTEGHGLWRYTPTASPARRFVRYNTQRGGLPDDSIYALACDAQGRMWIGTGRGLCVWDGQKVQTYGPLEGVGGWHVTAIAICPTDGDVWIATEGGLTRYSLQEQTWTQYTRMDGLPSDAISCLAFRNNGDLYVGTQADGIAVATAQSHYHTWQVSQGPEAMPLSASGAGLPTSLMNCLLVTKDGTVWAGTTTGLAHSTDGGKSWAYVRGADWTAKVKRLYHAPSTLIPIATPAPAHLSSPLLPLLTEDYITCLADDGAGHLIVGHRQQGVEILDMRTGERLFPPANSATENGTLPVYPTDNVASLLTTTNGVLMVGGYGGGLLALPLPAPDADAPLVPLPTPAPLRIGALPPPTAPPTLAQLNAMLKTVSAVPPDPQELSPHVVTLDDDWLTRGDWLGRYGRYWACLCAFFHPIPLDYLWGAGWQPVDYAFSIGPNRKPTDSVRYWLQQRYTKDQHALEMPPTYTDSRVLKGYTTWAIDRRDTSIDDHGEAYPLSMQGPDLYATVTVPDGLYILSLYEYNDAQGGRAATRDYRLSVREHAGIGLEEISEFSQQPELAHGRVTQFWGGVWKRFLVRGPQTLTVQINRNYSTNAILPAIMLDLVDETPPPYFESVAQWEKVQTKQYKQWQHRLGKAMPVIHPAASEAAAANHLFDALAIAREDNSTWWASSARPYYTALLIWYNVQASLPSTQARVRLWQRLGACYYALGMYWQWELCLRHAGLKPARDMEKGLRWDQVTPSNSGREYAVLTGHSPDPEEAMAIP